MAQFYYKAKRGPEEIVEGEVDAASEDAALGIIAGLGLIPIRITAAGGPEPLRKRRKAAEAAEGSVTVDPARIRIPHRDLNIFTRQFSILLKASVPLLRIFEVLQSQTGNQKFRQVLREIQSQMREGHSLSESLARYPRIFSEIYVSMVRAGEVSGSLDKVLARLAEFSEREAEVRSRVQAAFVYPLFLMLVGLATIFILLTFVMPRLMTLFADLGTELPMPTRVVMQASAFCRGYGIILMGIAAAAAAGLRSQGLSEGQRRALDRFVIRLPLFGQLAEKAETARFLRSLELLYENGIPLYQAVGVASQTVGNLVMRDEIEKVPERLEGGSTLAGSLAEVSYISDFVTNMVSVGEESGQLGSAVRETAVFYEQETQQAIKIATALLEPIMILVIGVVIGFIVIAMLLPIFEIHVLAQ